jgi:hypothetical protein
VNKFDFAVEVNFVTPVDKVQPGYLVDPGGYRHICQLVADVFAIYDDF